MSVQSYKYNWFKKALYPIGISLFIVAAISGLIISSIYSLQLLIFGLVTGSLVIGYYILRAMNTGGRIARYPKEFIVSFVFTVGIWGYYLLQIQQEYFTVILLTIGFFSSMLLNTHLFSFFERQENDRKHLSYIHGQKKHRVYITAIIFFGLAVNTIAILFHYKAGTILMAMFLYQTLIYVFSNKIFHTPYYGLTIDAVLMFPLFYNLL